MMIREVAEEDGTSYCFGQIMMNQDLGMGWVLEKFFPRVLTWEQKEHRLTASQELIDHAKFPAQHHYS